MIDDSDVMTLTVDRCEPPERVTPPPAAASTAPTTAPAKWAKVRGIPSSSRRTRAFAQSPDDQNLLFAGTDRGPVDRARTAALTWRLATQKELVINSVARPARRHACSSAPTARASCAAPTAARPGWPPTTASPSASSRSVVFDRVGRRVLAGIWGDRVHGGVFAAPAPRGPWTPARHRARGPRGALAGAARHARSWPAPTTACSCPRIRTGRLGAPAHRRRRRRRPSARGRRRRASAPQRLLAATSKGLLRSGDGGRTWARPPLGMPEQVSALAVSPERHRRRGGGRPARHLPEPGRRRVLGQVSGGFGERPGPRASPSCPRTTASCSRPPAGPLPLRRPGRDLGPRDRRDPLHRHHRPRHPSGRADDLRERLHLGRDLPQRRRRQDLGAHAHRRAWPRTASGRWASTRRARTACSSASPTGGLHLLVPPAPPPAPPAGGAARRPGVRRSTRARARASRALREPREPGLESPAKEATRMTANVTLLLSMLWCPRRSPPRPPRRSRRPRPPPPRRRVGRRAHPGRPRRVPEAPLHAARSRTSSRRWRRTRTAPPRTTTSATRSTRSRSRSGANSPGKQEAAEHFAKAYELDPAFVPAGAEARPAYRGGRDASRRPRIARAGSRRSRLVLLRSE